MLFRVVLSVEIMVDDTNSMKLRRSTASAHLADRNSKFHQLPCSIRVPTWTGNSLDIVAANGPLCDNPPWRARFGKVKIFICWKLDRAEGRAWTTWVAELSPCSVCCETRWFSCSYSCPLLIVGNAVGIFALLTSSFIKQKCYIAYKLHITI